MTHSVHNIKNCKYKLDDDKHDELSDMLNRGTDECLPNPSLYIAGFLDILLEVHLSSIEHTSDGSGVVYP
jgi:hypothetical protein